VHTAYVQQGPGAWDVTATASSVVAEEAAAVGARLVHLSTDFAALVVGHPVQGVPDPPGGPLECRLDSTLARGALSTRRRGVHDVLDKPG
jgi:hypothetical protein